MTLKVEVLIYAYLAICGAMILFNIVCIFVFRGRERRLRRRSARFTRAIEKQFEDGEPDEKHIRYLRRRLKRLSNMMAFDETLTALSAQHEEQVRSYIGVLRPLFTELTDRYLTKRHELAAYYLYIITKYRVFEGEKDTAVMEQILAFVESPNLYCRENALQALHSAGDPERVIDGLKLVDRMNLFHHSKMITDGLLAFRGDRAALDAGLWEAFPDFSLRFRRSLLDYFRFSSGNHCRRILAIMEDTSAHPELRFSAIRYFAKYPYEPARATICRFASEPSPTWEYRAIAASALISYPSRETEELLKLLLSDPNWHVRYNASDSLERLGLAYHDLLDVFEGRDRYASEMLRYRFDRKKLSEKEAVPL